MRAMLLLFGLTVLGGKLVAAARVDLFADEAFYWQCGQRLAISFADHPPLTALLVRAGTELFGDSTLAVRSVFLLLGALFPLVVHRIARPLVGHSDAWIAAGLSLMLPGLAHLGLVAVPDVAMLLLTALFLLGFERATRTGSAKAWWLAGLSGALGFATHYRFALAPLSAFAYLALTPRGRDRIRDRGLWLAVSVALLGLLPAIVYNLRSGLAPLRYHVVTRHGAEFDPSRPFLFLGEQMVLATPVFFLALLGVLGALLRRARRGDDRAALMSAFALAPLALFFLTSPFESKNLATAHWPMAGYLPLLVYLPGYLRRFVGRRPIWPRRALAALAPGLGAVFCLGAILELATGWLGIPSLRKPFLGWSELAERVEIAMLPEFDGRGERVIVVADNYKLGANLEFQLHDRIETYVLDHPKNHEHGRFLQLAAWDMDEEALRSRAGEDALVVVQVRELPASARPAWLKHIASFFETVEPIGELRVAGQGSFTWFRFYRGHRIKAQRQGV